MPNSKANSIAVWSAKGGSGTSTVAALLARCLAENSRYGAVLVDMCGDAADMVGAATAPPAPGVADCLITPAGTEVDAGRQCQVETHSGLAVLRRGSGALTNPAGATRLAAQLGRYGPTVIIDAGCLWRPGGDTAGGSGAGETPDDIDVRASAVDGAAQSWLVTRPCLMSLRRAATAPSRPDGVVLVKEPHRPINARDVEAVIGAPVVLTIDVSAAIAAATSGGPTTAPIPRSVVRATKTALDAHTPPAADHGGLTP